ncbi:HAD-IIA family hydrolase [uncultured Jatrophihabitans sp.]|uniref:HAD-IIA family hydrolase n=1 Tax=uncultured Jatrophihabitans sp. TaxID=1610747 RepID=UPI0035CBBFF9
MLDLDGVVYVGPDAVPGVPQALEQARGDGMRLAFVTNNAARTPQTIAQHLTELGIAAEPEEVITSSQAAARYLADRLPAGARVLVLGTTGLTEALLERGLTPVQDAQGQVDAVVQGFSPTMDWTLLSEGAVAINRRVPWVATNVDPTVPSPRGPLPGNGSLVKALQLATRVDPIVTGKPDPTMHRETVLRTGAATPLVVGDRLDTDIEGANAVGCDSVLVFSGVTTLSDLLRAGALHRPTYLGQDLSEILMVHPEVDVDGSAARCGRWRASAERSGQADVRALLDSVSDDAQRPNAGVDRRPAKSSSLDGSGYGEDQLDAIRALCAAIWAGTDAAAEQVVVSAGDSHDAGDMLAGLRIDAQ